MTFNFGKLFQTFSKDKKMRGTINVPDNPMLWPDSWKVIQYKTYDRFPKIFLTKPHLAFLGLEELIVRRSSQRWWKEEAITKEQFSTIFYYSAGVIKKGPNPNFWGRVHPSAGAQFPIEIYVLNLKEGDLKRKLYHYNVKEHAMDELWDIPKEEAFLSSLLVYPWSEDAGAIVIFTAVVGRLVKKYGERAYRQIYLEAGAICHTMHLVSSTAGLGSVFLSGTHDSQIEEFLDIDGERETLVFALALGVEKDKEI